MERKVTFRSVDPMPMGSVVATQVEPLPEGLLVITTVSVRTQLFGRGSFESKRRNEWENDWDYFPRSDFIVAQVFQVSAKVEIFHYGKEVQVVTVTDALRERSDGSREQVPLEPIQIGGRSVLLSLAGKGDSFKGHPVTLELLERLKESREAKRGEECSELSLTEKRSWERLAGLRRAGNLRGRFKRLCYFPKELIVTITDPGNE